MEGSTNRSLITRARSWVWLFVFFSLFTFAGVTTKNHPYFIPVKINKSSHFQHVFSSSIDFEKDTIQRTFSSIASHEEDQSSELYFSEISIPEIQAREPVILDFEKEVARSYVGSEIEKPYFYQDPKMGLVEIDPAPFDELDVELSIQSHEYSNETKVEQHIAETKKEEPSVNTRELLPKEKAMLVNLFQPLKEEKKEVKNQVVQVAPGLIVAQASSVPLVKKPTKARPGRSHIAQHLARTDDNTEKNSNMVEGLSFGQNYGKCEYSPREVIEYPKGRSFMDWSKASDVSIQSEVFSYEGLGYTEFEHEKWILYKNKRHDAQNTLLYSSEGQSQQIPFFVESVKDWMSNCRQISKDAGMIIARVSSGARIQLGSQSFKSISLEEEFSEGSIQSYELIPNLSPGYHLVYITDPRTSSPIAGIPVPVVAGTVTFLELSDLIQDETPSAQFFSMDSSQEEPLWGISGRVLANYYHEFTTDRDGIFELNKLAFVGNYPFVIESECGIGLTHRFKFYPGRMNRNLEYFCMSKASIQQIKKDLPKENSGVVWVSHPNWMSQELKLEVLGEKITKVKHQRKSTRFFQEDQQPFFVKVKDQKEKVLWSDSFLSSPNVITVLDGRL